MQLNRQIYIISRRLTHTLSEQASKIRNIALLAHIDAGKTTTTERLLYYSGKISQMGEVHYGNTVTDFMELERTKGITIASAFVTLPWKKHMINLVDTPGHIDFTMEVEQSLKVIDSAVIILDASAGVEAQTLTVYNQLANRDLPALFYVNKMDRKDADFNHCLSTIENKLAVKALPLHLPLYDIGQLGHIELVSMEQVLWTMNSETYSRTPLPEAHERYLDALSARLELVDVVSSIDDHLANIVLEQGSLESVGQDDLRSAIGRITVSREACPVICGSSYKNIGIESLLDAIVQYLPTPLQSAERHLSELSGSLLLARCFKIIHDKQRGAVALFRIYSGQLSKSQKVYNICQNRTEQIGRLLRVFANDMEDVQSETCGHFVAATGLKEIMSGDMICSTANELKQLKAQLALKLKTAEDIVTETILRNSSVVPEPVFFCSAEPQSQRWQTELDKALKELQKEDPSIRVDFDEDSGQTVLAGMGELHLQIVREKLLSNYGIQVDLGPIQIAYKERLLTPLKETMILRNSAGGQEHSVTVTVSLQNGERKEIMSLDTSGDSAENLSKITPKQIYALKSGIKTALKHGPLYSCQVVNVHAVVHWLVAKKSTPESVIVAATAQCVSKILQQSGTQLLEPFMLLNIRVPEMYLKSVMMDLSKRRALELNVDNSGSIKEIYCEAPLAELMGYANYLRTITSGTGTFVMHFSVHRPMSVQDQTTILNKHIT
ncbi:mitochondrial ribosome recycling factor 2 isoform X2 [Rhodnius prolixus]|uniref:mitochondrial ribosome recycling factor 2 isoform X2 n=1 Tax=Rhodnius prolixus TaxID=13249 RepID=UPI003D18B753